MDFIETQTAGATFCRRSDKVQEVTGGKEVKVCVNNYIYLTIYI